MAISKGRSERVEPIEWNVDMEVQLFYAMRGHKPVGVNRHFQMACIHEKFKNSIQKDISTKQIWDHLESMYDMAALHESEIVPFPNEEGEFCLPENEFSVVAKKDDEVKATTAVKSKDSSGDEEPREVVREVTVPKPRERIKESREREVDSAENSPKRKRTTRQNQESSGSKLTSPAVSSSSTPGGANKRRRT